MIVFVLMAAALVLVCPGDALAWGPITHIVHGSAVLASLDLLPAAMQALLTQHPGCYLYGCVGADIIQAKAYTRDVSTHCHRWPVAWRIVEEAETDRERAFAWGYMTHLAADIVSHNHFVPSSLLRSFPSPALGHAYWEARADALQNPEHRAKVRELLTGSYRDCDALVGRVVEHTLLSFKTNKRIFDSMLALSKLDRWQSFLKTVTERSRYALGSDTVHRYNGACITAAQDLLANHRESYTQTYDPTGHEVLARAIALRRRLRALKRARKLDPTLEREIEKQIGPDDTF